MQRDESKDGGAGAVARNPFQSLRRRGSLIVGTLGLPTGAGWQTVAGFQKLSENNA